MTGSMMRRTVMLYALLVAFLFGVGLWQGSANLSLILAQALGYVLIALGLNIQFGYGGLFNFGIMGFIMVGGFVTVLVSAPVNGDFWNSDGPIMLCRAMLAAAAGALLIWAAHHADRVGVKGRLRIILIVLAWFAAYVLYRSQIDPAAAFIEDTSGWVGGLALHPLLGWPAAGIAAGGVAYVIGKIALGLRTDYLAIATIGIAEIIRAFIKNMDWLTRGTLTVTPVPWPTPLPQALQADGMSIGQSFIVARLGFIAVTLIAVLAVIYLLARAYRGPWGRMMRAIRDNHIAAGSMGKDVTRRQLEIFVLGSVLMGAGGAVLVSFNQILDPSGYLPINHNFMIWVMVIVGGAGNNWGAVLGAILIYTVWIISDPFSQLILLNISALGEHLGWGSIPEIQSRSVQMRVFFLGLIIWLVLRYAPKGLLPEVIRREN